MKIFLILFISGLAGFVVSLYRHAPSPMLDPHVQTIETFHYPVSFVKQLQGDPAAGKKIFRQFCMTCHGHPPIIAIQAPQIGDQKAWAARRNLGMKTLLDITVKGIGAMPARGGCFECSDQQLIEAIHYILKQTGVSASANP